MGNRNKQTKKDANVKTLRENTSPPLFPISPSLQTPLPPCYCCRFHSVHSVRQWEVHGRFVVITWWFLTAAPSFLLFPLASAHLPQASGILQEYALCHGAPQPPLTLVFMLLFLSFWWGGGHLICNINLGKYVHSKHQSDQSGSIIPWLSPPLTVHLTWSSN